MMGFKETGIVSLDELKEKNLLPSEKILHEKFVPFVECVENIPCNPCAAVCPTGAITKQTITQIPHVEGDKCIACLKCVVSCPGLAIFLGKIEGDKAKLYLPYEMLPVPKKGEVVALLDREGREVGKGEVFFVAKFPDKTCVVGVIVDKGQIWNVRGIRAEVRA